MPEEKSLRSRRWESDPRPRYWWHRLPGMNFLPPVYSDLSDEEWTILREWYEETDGTDAIGECAVPLISLLQGLVMGSRAGRIVQLGTCSGYSAILLGFMLRRMNVARGLLSLDIGPQMCAVARRWIARAGLNEFVEIVQLDSTDTRAPKIAIEFLGGDPELIIVDSSHQYRATLAELDLWYPALANGGLIVLHDVSRFAAGFDITGNGGVRRAFDEWRKAHPQAETLCLNGESQTMDLPRPLYKDACGLGLIHKSGIPSEMEARTEVVYGDITKIEADAIVNAANTSLLGGGGVDGAIHRAAGLDLLDECRSLGGCRPGEAKITRGYRLPARFVIHTVGPFWSGGKRGEAEVLANCYRNSLRLAVGNAIKTIAFPAISCGAYRYPIAEAAKIAVETTVDFLRSHREIEKVTFVVSNEQIYNSYREVLP